MKIVNFEMKYLQDVIEIWNDELVYDVINEVMEQK